jgi:hypothetical protein
MARYLSRETEPLGKWRGMPIYLTTILAGVFVIGLLVSATLASARSPWIKALVFTVPNNSWAGWLSILSYPFIDRPSFFTPLAILCFYWWAVGIETHLGRGPLVRLLCILTLVPAAFLGVVWFSLGSGGVLAGNFLITAGLLVAFATLYPNADWAGWVPFKYLAFASILCGSLMLIADRDWLGIAELWVVCAGSFLYMRHAIEQEHDDHVPLAARVHSWFRRKPSLRIVPQAGRPARGIPRREISDDAEDTEVDGLLDKIAQNGISSLTEKERAALERAREELLKKERK